MNKTCNTCLLGDKIQKRCRLSGIPIDPEKDFCSHYTDSLENCEICGHPMLTEGSFIEQDDNGVWHQYCSNCAKLLQTCQTCSNPCEFESNPDPMPKVVIKTVRQGNMQMQTQVMNPERIQKFCPSCNCYDEEVGCKRVFNDSCCKKPNFWSSRNSVNS